MPHRIPKALEIAKVSIGVDIVVGRGKSNLSRDIFSLRFSDAKLIIVEAHTYHGVHQFLAFASLESAQTRGLIRNRLIPIRSLSTWQFCPSPIPQEKKSNNKTDSCWKYRDRQIFQKDIITLTILNKPKKVSWFYYWSQWKNVSNGLKLN